MRNSQSTGPCLPCGPHPPMQPENGALDQGRIRRRPVGILRLGLNSVLFCVAAAFFCGLVPGEPGGDGVWVRQPSAVWQQNVLRAPEEPELLFEVGSSFCRASRCFLKMEMVKHPVFFYKEMIWFVIFRKNHDVDFFSH